MLIKDLDEVGYIPFMESYAGRYRIGIAEKKIGVSPVFI